MEFFSRLSRALSSSLDASHAVMSLAAQGIVFALGALHGPRHHPYGLIFSRLVAPRLTPVTEREPAATAVSPTQGYREAADRAIVQRCSLHALRDTGAEYRVARADAGEAGLTAGKERTRS